MTTSEPQRPDGPAATRSTSRKAAEPAPRTTPSTGTTAPSKAEEGFGLGPGQSLGLIVGPHRTDNTELGKLLKELRDHLGLSAAEAANRAKVTPAYIRMLEKSGTAPSLGKLVELLQAYQVSTEVEPHLPNGRRPDLAWSMPDGRKVIVEHKSRIREARGDSVERQLEDYLQTHLAGILADMHPDSGPLTGPNSDDNRRSRSWPAKSEYSRENKIGLLVQLIGLLPEETIDKLGALAADEYRRVRNRRPPWTHPDRVETDD